jgi:hypothetical protein
LRKNGLMFLHGCLRLPRVYLPILRKDLRIRRNCRLAHLVERICLRGSSLRYLRRKRQCSQGDFSELVMCARKYPKSGKLFPEVNGGGGWRVQGELFRRLMECSHKRLRVQGRRIRVCSGRGQSALSPHSPFVFSSGWRRTKSKTPP